VQREMTMSLKNTLRTMQLLPEAVATLDVSMQILAMGTYWTLINIIVLRQAIVSQKFIEIFLTMRLPVLDRTPLQWTSISIKQLDYDGQTYRRPFKFVRYSVFSVTRLC
jgi:hypothetical protein